MVAFLEQVTGWMDSNTMSAGNKGTAVRLINHARGVLARHQAAADVGHRNGFAHGFNCWRRGALATLARKKKAQQYVQEHVQGLMELLGG